MHHELVDCLRFVIIVCSVPARDAAAEAVVLCHLAPSALSTVTSRYMCISLGWGTPRWEVCVIFDRKKILTIKMKWDIKG